MATYNGSNFRWITNIRHIQLSDTDDRFRANNPIILPGELALVTDKRKIKIGTGSRYTDTRYIAGTDPIHADNLAALPTIDLSTMKFVPSLDNNSVLIEDFLTIEDYVISPRSLASSVSVKKETADKSTQVYGVNNLQDWIDKLDLGIVSNTALRIGDNTTNEAYITINSSNSSRKVEGYKKPSMYILDDTTSDGIAFSFCVRDSDGTNRAIMSIHNNGVITNCTIDKANSITTRNIKLTGAVSGNADFDGTKDIIIPVTAKDVAPKNLIFKNITLASPLFNDRNQFIFNNTLIKSTHVPNLYISRETLPYAEEAGITVYTTNGSLIIECSEVPINNIIIETAILIPT